MKRLGLVCLIITLLALPMSALALEKMSGTDLGDVTGQAGVTIAFGGTTTTTITFSAVAWGDPDGVGLACSANAGWLILDGDGASSVSISQVVGCGQMLTLDIGEINGACTMAPCSISIPDGTTFIAVGLPTVTLSISIPATLVVGLGNTSTAISGTLGLVNLRNLSVSAGSPEQLYIWAH